MKIVIVGGHGKIGLLLTRLLAGAGHEVRSLIRNPDHAADVEGVGGRPAVADLEAITSLDLIKLIGEADVAVFAAGAGPGSDSRRKKAVDYQGAIKLISAALQTGVQHYMMISAKKADAEHTGDEVFDIYLRAKGKADLTLKASGLPFTVVAPTTLTNDEPSGTVTLGETAEGGNISRADVAATVAALVETGKPQNQRLELTAGSTPIEEAVAALQ
ncbi:MAG: SDR family oxidoreductase [Actinomycetota bacterium]